eukprot:TRINITY_DN37337_c0_g1_i1.p1 TRINITY_DN37337_c0_g1~~TRINITY_DN37337_c0_g1_i1.p1  ORF type:complete len:209 (+),score=24.76 TRINITY_DN37337_c0_g1_i1:179-805(+)
MDLAPPGHLVVSLAQFSLPKEITDTLLPLLSLGPASCAAPTFLRNAQLILAHSHLRDIARQRVLAASEALERLALEVLTSPPPLSDELRTDPAACHTAAQRVDAETVALENALRALAAHQAEHAHHAAAVDAAIHAMSASFGWRSAWPAIAKASEGLYAHRDAGFFLSERLAEQRRRMLLHLPPLPAHTLSAISPADRAAFPDRKSVV